MCELVLFETVKIAKNILIYEWRGLNEDDKLTIRQKLLDYVINNQQLHLSGLIPRRIIAMKLLHTIFFSC